MTFFSDPESNNLMVKGLVVIVSGLGALLVAVGKRLGGDALADIKELQDQRLVYVTREELRVCQVQNLQTVKDGFDRITESMNILSARLDTHIERRSGQR